MRMPPSTAPVPPPPKPPGPPRPVYWRCAALTSAFAMDCACAASIAAPLACWMASDVLVAFDGLAPPPAAARPPPAGCAPPAPRCRGGCRRSPTPRAPATARRTAPGRTRGSSRAAASSSSQTAASSRSSSASAWVSWREGAQGICGARRSARASPPRPRRRGRRSTRRRAATPPLREVAGRGGDAVRRCRRSPRAARPPPG